MTAPPRAVATPRRILITADAVGGVWQHTLELARALSDQGVEIVLAMIGPAPTRSQAATAMAIRGLSLRHHGSRLPWMDDPWDDVRHAGDWLMGLATATGCDLAHLSEPVFGALAWSIPTIAVGHSCVLSWHQAVHDGAAAPTWDRYHRAMRQGFAAAGATVAPTHAMLDALRRYYGVRGGTVIPNGRDSARYRPKVKENVVFIAGRLWDPAKNLAALAGAAGSLPWPVWAAGPIRGPNGATSAGHDAVIGLGELDEAAMADRFSRAAVYALPAKYEPFGLTVLEAALSGCALVLGDIPSLRELWHDAALFVPPDDVGGIEAAIRRLMTDGSLCRSLAHRARHRALGRSPRRMARAYLDVYARVLRADARRISACAS
jgi:glycogen synthase